MVLIFLKDITAVTRTDLKAYCFELVTKDRSYFLSCKNDEELYSWMHEIYSRSPLMGVSHPTNFVHKVHVGFDSNTGNFTVCAASHKGLGLFPCRWRRQSLV